MRIGEAAIRATLDYKVVKPEVYLGHVFAAPQPLRGRLLRPEQSTPASRLLIAVLRRHLRFLCTDYRVASAGNES